MTMTDEGPWGAPSTEPIEPDEPSGSGRPRWFIPALAALCLVAVIAVMVGVSSSHDDGPSQSKVSATPISLTRSVTYMVTGDHTNQASITYETPTGTGQQSDIDVPLTRKSDGDQGLLFHFQAGAFVYISAQNSNESGAVTCTITVDGIVIAHNTSSGAYAIASCKGEA